MAISKNPALKDFRGTIDKQIVVRQDQFGRTILSSYPDMSNIIPTEKQLACRALFAKAQKYAKEFLLNPENKAFYQEKCVGKQRPHNVLISELRKGITPFPPDDPATIDPTIN